MSNAITVKTEDANAIVRRIALSGNLKSLSEPERWQYYEAFCRHLGLEPTTRPFDVIDRDGKVNLYPNANCAAQLGERMRLSFPEYKTEVIADAVFVYRVLARDSEGREAWGTGAVPMGRTPLEIASAIKKAETQAKRRVTLSMGGLGITDSDEMIDLGAQVVEQAEEAKRTRKSKAETVSPNQRLQAESISEQAMIIRRKEKEIGDTVSEILAQLPQNFLRAEVIKVLADSQGDFDAALKICKERAGEYAQRAAEFERQQQAEAYDRGQDADNAAMLAEHKKLFWEDCKKQSVTSNDAREIWKHFNESLPDAQNFIRVFPRYVPVIVSVSEALTIWEDCGRVPATAIASAKTYGERKAAEMLAPENSVSFDSEPTAEEYAAAAESVADWEETPQKAAFDAQAPIGVTRANRDLSNDPVGLDVTPFWKWVKSNDLDATLTNRKRLNEIIALNSTEHPARDRNGKPNGRTEIKTNWQAIIHQVKIEFTK